MPNLDNFTPKQAVLPLFISEFWDIRDPVLVFDRFMEEIDLEKYLKHVPKQVTGRLRYNPINMLKTVLFGFTINGFSSLREMGNDQLLPAYNVQLGIADEYIAVVDVTQYRSDMDCFIPLMERFYRTYGFYPKYPIADAGYGSYNNYLYCEQHGMEKYMKFPMFAKETKDEKYRNDPYRPINYKIDKDGTLRCPAGRAFLFEFRQNIKGNQYGRQEEVYQCESCAGCPYAEKCKKTDKNKTIHLNRELTSMHQDVIRNLESIQGVLLRMNRSIQSEGTFGIIKNDRWYKRIVRRGMNSVRLELFLVAIGHNLYKYHNKILRADIAA